MDSSRRRRQKKVELSKMTNMGSTWRQLCLIWHLCSMTLDVKRAIGWLVPPLVIVYLV